MPDVRVITSIHADGDITHKYYDLRSGRPVVMSSANYESLTKVQCATNEADWEEVCLRPIGIDDVAQNVTGNKTSLIRTSFRNVQGDVRSVAQTNIVLMLDDGTDVSTTHQVVGCNTEG